MTTESRVAVYERQNGGDRLTPKQIRRAWRKFRRDWAEQTEESPAPPR